MNRSLIAHSLDRIVFAVGSGALLVGAAKLLSHSTISGDALASICGSDMTLDLALWQLQNAEHCWGCPLALAGLTVMAASLLVRKQPSGPDAQADTPVLVQAR